MDRARVLVCLCVCVAIVHGQVASICRPNERLLMCGGCQKTCLDPVPECKGVCRPGCYCNDDEVRNATGHCVKLSECPRLPASYKQQTTEPRPADAKCPDNEEYRFCEACNKTCENPNPICPAQCARGCFCKKDLVRDRDGRCVKLEKCSNKSSNEIPHTSPLDKPVNDSLTCKQNQIFKPCGNCEKSCSNPNPICPAQCSRGCFCKDGFYKAPNGDCVTIDKCPKAHTSPLDKPVNDSLTCKQNQIFKPCGNCEKSCSNPKPICPAQCSRGCFCKDGFYKAPNGDCVTIDKCPKAVPVTLKPPPIAYELTCGPNQVFKPCENCEKTCSNPNPQCPAQCSRGCFCKDGLYKAPNGECVKLEQCPKGL
ncbi:hypothetical protein ABMA28_005430 [Loxostege sticticalis]|uniref:TIL domain-containing protein n=1 Tax=Loxostege sticticalis TaxID=481309 RepID=A0ABD0SQE7_LOXSC